MKVFWLLCASLHLEIVGGSNINSEFRSFLHGETFLNDDTMQRLWDHFERNEGKQSPVANRHPEKRRAVFEESVKAVIEHNSNRPPGDSSVYIQGINKFSDMTELEFSEYFGFEDTRVQFEQHCSAQGAAAAVAAASSDQLYVRTSKGRTLNTGSLEGIHWPKRYDWRDYGCVSPVKNQGKCGSCWTFSTVGALESHSLIKYAKFTPLSEQQLVDCAGGFDNHGCGGGLPSHAFEYIALQSHGMSTEDAYPYHHATETCNVDPKSYKLTVEGGAVNITMGDEVELYRAIMRHGPVSVAFDVVSGFKSYNGGVYSSTTCNNTSSDVNHAVLAVGYGVEMDGTKYWIIKNSWGTDWGDDGYFKIKAGENMCGIAVCNSYPKAVKNVYPEK